MLVTKLIKLEMGCYWELIQFVVVPKMTESIIRGLVWLDKWSTMISWEGGYQKLRLAVSPDPPAILTEREALQRLSDTNRGEKAAATPEPLPGTPQIPREYQDLAEVFGEEECSVLPPTRMCS